MLNPKSYITLVDFLGAALGPNCEVVLHDVSNPEESIIAIANGQISGRRIGGPVTDLVLKVMIEGNKNTDKKFICNYATKLKGNKECRSSSYFIRDAKGMVRYVLCINFNVTPLLEMEHFIHNLIHANPEEKAAQSTMQKIEVLENFSDSIEEVLQAITRKVLSEFSEPPNRMSVDERLEVIQRFNEHGIFLLKGGVSEVAASMELSEATVYRYLNKIKS